VQVGYLE